MVSLPSILWPLHQSRRFWYAIPVPTIMEAIDRLVIDPYLIDGKSLGFDVFRGDLRARKWYSIPHSLKEPIDARALPSLLEFINPVIEGKDVYLEYDEG